MFFIGKYRTKFQPIAPCKPSPIFDGNGKRTGEFSSEKMRTQAITEDGRLVELTSIPPQFVQLIDDAVKSRELLEFEKVNLAVLPRNGGGISTYLTLGEAVHVPAPVVVEEIF